ncbi:MAG: endolytic transglycosylase MltG [Candidatus Hydrogenedentota bacterium]
MYKYIISVILIIIVITGLYVKSNLQAPENFISEKTVYITPGANTDQIAKYLKMENIIKNRFIFKMIVKYKGYEKRLKAGYYLIQKKSDVFRVVDILVEGKELAKKITIREGLTVKEVVEDLVDNGFGSEEEYNKILKDERLLKELIHFAKSYEGFLFPQTYYFRINEIPENIIKRLLEEFRKSFQPEFEQRASSIGLSCYEAIILASIVEKEANKEEERPVIAGIFLKRLRSGRKLEACPTIRYILNPKRPNLLYEDLEIDSPYNTYLYPGLPPTPICNPSISSIKAVLYYEETPYLYFVSDNKGGHYFSSTLSEHNRYKVLVSK